MFPELQDIGVKYIRHGDTARLPCVHRFGWLSNHYSVARCSERRLTLSECKYDFITVILDFRLCLITTSRDGVLPVRQFAEYLHHVFTVFKGTENEPDQCRPLMSV